MKEQEEKSVLSVMRHSAEHVLMQAMKKVFGEDKIIMAMGPSTDEGFYFDFDSPEGFEISEENFGTIEAEMRKIKEPPLGDSDEFPFYVSCTTAETFYVFE